MSVARLLLYPKNTQAKFATIAKLPDALQHIGLIGARMAATGAEYQYLAGEDFLERVVYLGCSPLVNLSATEDTPSGMPAPVWIEWHPPGEAVVFYSGQNTLAPRCPACRQTASDWRSLVAAWQKNSQHHLWTCLACGHESNLYQLDWRRNAAFARCSLQLPGIYPAEALPDDVLLNTLAQQTGTPWTYCYLHQAA